MATLKNWKIRRSGATLTIEGVNNDTNENVKLTNIEEVASGSPPTATDKNNKITYLLT